MPAENCERHDGTSALLRVFTRKTAAQLPIERPECQWEVDVSICVNVCMPVKELNPDQAQVKQTQCGGLSDLI